MNRIWVFQMTLCGMVVTRHNNLVQQDEVFNFQSQNFEALPTTGLPASQHVLVLKRIGPGGSALNYCQYGDIPDAAFQPGASVVSLFLNGDGTLTVNSPGSAGGVEGLDSSQGPGINISFSR